MTYAKPPFGTCCWIAWNDPEPTFRVPVESHRIEHQWFGGDEIDDEAMPPAKPDSAKPSGVQIKVESEWRN